MRLEVMHIKKSLQVLICLECNLFQRGEGGLYNSVINAF